MQQLQTLRDEQRLHARQIANLHQGASAAAEALADVNTRIQDVDRSLQHMVGDIATGRLRLFGVAAIVTGIAFVSWAWWWPERPWAAVFVFVGLVAVTL